MSRIADAALRVPASGIREIVNLAMTLPPPDIDRLEIGEPDFRTPDHIVDAAMSRARAGVGYTHSAGLGQLREVIAQNLASRDGLEYGVDDVIVTAGGVQACHLVMSAILSPGDEVLIPDPAWPNYRMIAVMARAVPVGYPLRAANGFVPDIDDIIGRMTPRTRILILNSPANPTGAVFSADVVRTIVQECADRGVIVVSDEVYNEIIFEGEPARAAQYSRDHVVGVYSLSKTFAMTGWRVGYVASPEWLAPTLSKLQEPIVSCVSEVAQAAAIAAISGPKDEVQGMRDEYRSRRDLAIGLLAAAGLEVPAPRGAFYAMVPFAPGVSSRDACLDLVGHGVALAPGSAFGDAAKSFARLSLAASETTLRRGIERFASWYERTDGGLAIGDRVASIAVP